MLIHAPTRSVLLQAPDPFMIRELIPKSRLLPHADYNIAVQHTLDTTRVLRNLGLDVPAPIRVSYRWPGKYQPFAHQQVMAEFLTLHRRAFNLSEMGVGKSAAALWAADWLMRAGKLRKVLILSPLSTLERVWRSDIFDVLLHRVAVVVYGTREQRLEKLKTPADFYILNHDGICIASVADAIRRDPEIDLVIVDEAGMFRNGGTRKYKALDGMLRDDMRLWLLTGTPCPNAPTDAWATARLVNPHRVPRYFGGFKRATMLQVSNFKWVPRADAYSIAYDAMQPAVRYKKADCLDLPPVVTTDRQCRLTQEQRDAVEQMRKEMQAELQSGVEITAVNAADKILKIRQIMCGCVRDTQTGAYITLPHAPRLATLLETIGEANAKALVICPFKGVLPSLEAAIGARYSVAVLNGDVTPKRRNEIIADFKTGADPHVLLCHPKVMAHGLNLTEADTLIFYAPIYSNDEYQQVIERFNRTGQTRKMTVVRMAAHPLEWEIYSQVDGKRLTQDSILQLFRTITGTTEPVALNH